MIWLPRDISKNQETLDLVEKITFRRSCKIREKKKRGRDRAREASIRVFVPSGIKRIIHFDNYITRKSDNCKKYCSPLKIATMNCQPKPARKLMKFIEKGVNTGQSSRVRWGLWDYESNAARPAADDFIYVRMRSFSNLPECSRSFSKLCSLSPIRT